ncbi:hypothetical protein MBLNU459_g1392t1 [Dothideomycetes sp. NU459]
MTPPRKKARLSADAGQVAKIEEATVDAPAAAAAAAAPVPATTTADGDKDGVSQRRSLFVRSLPATTTTESLTEIFSQSYPIKHATAVTDKETKQCKGYGFVTFADAEDCQRAKEEFNGFVVEGKKLRVEIAEPRQREKEPGATPVVSAVQKAKEQREKDKAEYTVPKLIVRNLPWSIKKPDQLAKLFMSYGKVKHATIPNKKPGLMAGFGFIVMRGRKNAEKALEGVNGKEIDGRTLAVDWAVEKEVWQKQNEPEEKVGGDEHGDSEESADDETELQGDGVFNEDDMDDEDDEDDSELDDMDEDDEDLDMDDEDDRPRQDDNSSTLFIRNLPFSCTDETLEDHFSQFGSVRYARIVLDRGTERPRGNGFVCFYNIDDADECIKNGPRYTAGAQRPTDNRAKDSGSMQISKSILQNEDADPTGKYTMDGRILQVSRAVNKSEANRLTEEGVANRFKRDTDRRRLYLLSEGTIPTNSPLYETLAPSEQTMREASAKQRKTLIESNPSLHLSLTRLSIRNIPRTITSKDLKQLAREAVVGFATDVKEGKREKLSKEELARGAEEMQKAEKERKSKNKGVVKQAKIVFEGREGGKVEEKSGAGRSRGYGFIEYYTHRSALMGLRWLNGHAIGYQVQEKQGKGKKMSKEDLADRKKRLIVEFAIENAQVVGRRNENQAKMREGPRGERKPRDGKEERFSGRKDRDGGRKDRDGGRKDRDGGRKRKRDGKDEADQPEQDKGSAKVDDEEKLAKRNRIIQQKRMKRRDRKRGGNA